ncbi:D-beta-hydroxybutyrate dehydrogenase, mitochondrial [Halotydeus destructor]|nr:D-beta-hydroxybutyrate dehydrogenase, mitochondrial [Halotydeus destructor]
MSQAALKTFAICTMSLFLLSLLSSSFDKFVILLGKFIVYLWLGWQLSALIRRIVIIPKKGKISPQGKAVLITGCDTGFGYMDAIELNKYGFHVFATCLQQDGDGAKGLRANVKDPAKLTIIPMNVTVDQDIDAAYVLVEKTLVDDGLELWAMVNNAGIIRFGEQEWGSFQYNFESVMQVNLLGLVKVTRKFLPLVRKARGRIVNMNSTASRIPIPGVVQYCTSKAASLAFTEGLRRELFKFKVDVISIEPFIYATPMAVPSTIEDSLDTNWELSTDEVKQSYGLHYFKRFKKPLVTVNKATKYSVNPRASEVVDAIFDALTSHSPNSRYNCCPISWRFLIWLGMIIPTDWLDFVFAHGIRLSGRGRPLPGNNRSIGN